MASMPFLSTETAEIFCESRGTTEGPPIVLLHGLGSSSSDWRPLIPAFEANHRLIIVDLPGHGRSKQRAKLSVDAMAGEVAALLAALDEQPAHVVGLSLGGCVALALALRSPERVRSLTLVNAFARLRPTGPRSVMRMLTRATLLTVAPMRVVAANVARGLFPHPHQRDLYVAAVTSLAQTPRRAYRASARALLGFDVTARLGEIDHPTLVIAGSRDVTVPLAAKEELARGIRGARLLVLPDSGHATPFDQMEMFSRAVLEFIGGSAATLSPH